MKLYITAAYLRKHSALPEIRSETNVRNSSHFIASKSHFICVSQLQTTVYMSCGRCGKAILAQQGGSMCATCRSPAARCSIWYVFLQKWYSHSSKQLTRNNILSHLPVKTMLFQCAICSHGGHQACYRRFYTEIPLAVLPAPPQAPSSGSPMKFPPRLYRSASVSRSKDREGDDAADIVAPDDSFDTSTVTPAPRQLMGHPCAAGCGHFCWVANFREDDLPEKP